MANIPSVITIAGYIKTDWLSYADYDNRRKLPHIMDGLKITQRKLLYTANSLSKGDMPRVSQLASKASEMTIYHHGEASMVSATVGLAQDFPGANNYPWLAKRGQFGTRLSKDSAAPRYINTCLHDNWHTFFPKEDQRVVNHLYDNGDKIEPEYYIPIIPTILLNGMSAPGNGFKSLILPYKASDIAKACMEVLKEGKVITPLVPKIRGWNGTIAKNDRQVSMTGILKIINTTRVEITELPPKYDNDSYKEELNKLLENKIIKNYHNHSNEDKWHWIIECPRELTAKGVPELLKIFKLIERNTETFVFWDVEGKRPVALDSPEEVVEYWFKERIPLYQKSIDFQIESAKADIISANLKMQFINWCLKNDFRKLTKAEFIEKAMTNVKNLSLETATNLVAMPMYRITKDEVEKLENEIDSLLDALDVLEELTPQILMEQNLKTVKAA